MEGKIKLTQYSHGAGCGCKIAPEVLQNILANSGRNEKPFKELLVGYESADDAAVWDLGNEKVLITTTDFFLPIVDDAFTFGKIAATNALSDVYAMGGKPTFALALLGFPVEKLPTEIASEILKGARSVTDAAGIPIAGGHTIDNVEPLFGLVVNGIADKKNIRKNNSLHEGDFLFLTKSIGTGILSTALKRSLVTEEQIQPAIDSMCQLNSAGEIFGAMDEVRAMTDVTGFGLLGHLLEMCGDNFSAEIYYNQIKQIEGAKELAQKFVAPDNTFRNWKSYETKVSGITGESLITLCDPQTSGGLLVSVAAEYKNEFSEWLKKNGFEKYSEPIGKVLMREEKPLPHKLIIRDTIAE